MAPKIAPANGYIMLLRDGQALPKVTPEDSVRPGTMVIKYPSRDAWIYDGRDWQAEPIRAEITLGLILGLLERVLALQEQQLALWKQQVT